MKIRQLDVRARTVIGRSVKTLRRSGIIPGTMYGKTIKPLSIQVALDKFLPIFKQAGETGLINLMIDQTVYPVLVKKVQRDPVSDLPLHVEFHRVDLKEKIRANVPIVVVGEAPAVKEKAGTLLQLLNELEVEALPADLPDRIEVDVSQLIHVNDHIMVKNLHIPDSVHLVTDPEIMAVKIGELLAPEPEPTPVPVEGEAVEAEEGKEAVPEGEQRVAEEKTEEAPKSAEPQKKE